MRKNILYKRIFSMFSLLINLILTIFFFSHIIYDIDYANKDFKAIKMYAEFGIIIQIIMLATQIIFNVYLKYKNIKVLL
jgi:hypothetical protein